MAYEHKELSGSLFEQNDKTKDSQPDLKGKIKIQGKLWDIAAWRSDRNPGMFSIKISEPRGPQQGGYTGEPTNSNPRRESTNHAVRDSVARQTGGRPKPLDELPEDQGTPIKDDEIPF